MMDVYEKMVLKKVSQFESTFKTDSEMNMWSKKIQQKVDGLIPRRIHQSLAVAFEKGIKAFLQGLNLYYVDQPNKKEGHYSLHILTEEAEQIVRNYTKIASIEGAGTGFGGFIASTIDFPALISIKLKMLQELAVHFGYSMENLEERIFLIKVLQLQFSKGECKRKTWEEIKNWEKNAVFQEWSSWEDFNWEEFYMEYKQSIELLKLFQMLPGLGAVVGAVANHSFVLELGNTAILSFQLRKIQEIQGNLL
ncbi:EcsC family protein [Caldalkalibacillus mannanilyticus]|uniref:EcsC family protein n=1 Tax=Caldalkalibacillus mannanilyticus TaxID=1418 RepID=UPI0009DF5BA0|nr:EcsC family protein [Caldalkalibacillus mannanilyticus]